jgi:NitT/TauT family transport system ATP-binding protein
MPESTTRPDADRAAGTEAVTRGEVLLAVRGLSKSYEVADGVRQVIDDVGFTVRRGEVATIVGPSGAGKTTLLRCMAGLLEPTGGLVELEGVRVTEPPERLAVVFQDYSRSLMPWMSVQHNVELPLRGKGVDRTERRRRAEQALRDVGLPDCAAFYPWQLSGGMQQRVAIARALAYGPEALLMDEPFASVDAQTRADLEDLVLDLRDRLGITILLVTHDIDEAVYLGDVVIVLSGSPACVDDCLPIPLGSGRDQVTTKARPEFVELRSRVMRKIRVARETARA